MFVTIPDAQTIAEKDCIFYHKMDFPDGSSVDGRWDLRGRLDDYLGGVDVSGKTFLDIGTASGFLSFEAEKHGADVVSFDMDTPARQHLLPFRGHKHTENWSQWVEDRQPMLDKWHNGYFLAHGKHQSKARLFHGDIYTMPRDMEERFDVVLLGCILEHLSNPLLAIQAAALMARETLVITDRLFGDSDNKIAVFKGSADAPGSDFVWWELSRGLYNEYLSILGFEIEEITHNTFAQQGVRHDQRIDVGVTTLVCRRK